jgi:16S rRNA processing protein RimM
MPAEEPEGAWRGTGGSAGWRCRPHGGRGAEGFLVGAPRAALPKTEEDEFYWVDLVGLEVVNTAGERLGKVAGLIETGANAVLRVVGDDDGAERLLPFVSAVVLAVDREAGRIRVEWGGDW